MDALTNWIPDDNVLRSDITTYMYLSYDDILTVIWHSHCYFLKTTFMEKKMLFQKVCDNYGLSFP